MTQVTLKTFENNKEISEQKTIKPMDVFQIQKLAKNVNALLKEIKSNEFLQKALEDIFKSIDKTQKLNRELIAKNKENDRVTIKSELYTFKDEIIGVGHELSENVLGSLTLLLEDAPESIVNVLSTATRIDVNTLNAQDPYTFLDIFDAVVEVNDVPKLVERLKKSKGSIQTVVKAIFTKKEKKQE